jgi:hypothetical protein
MLLVQYSLKSVRCSLLTFFSRPILQKSDSTVAVLGNADTSPAQNVCTIETDEAHVVDRILHALLLEEAELLAVHTGT